MEKLITIRVMLKLTAGSPGKLVANEIVWSLRQTTITEVSIRNKAN